MVFWWRTVPFGKHQHDTLPCLYILSSSIHCSWSLAWCPVSQEGEAGEKAYLVNLWLNLDVSHKLGKFDFYDITWPEIWEKVAVPLPLWSDQVPLLMPVSIDLTMSCDLTCHCRLYNTNRPLTYELKAGHVENRGMFSTSGFAAGTGFFGISKA